MTDCEYILELHTEIRVQRVGCDGVVLVIARMRLADQSFRVLDRGKICCQLSVN